MRKKPNMFSDLKLLEDAEKLQNIGSAIVKEAVLSAVLQKVKNGDDRKSLVINKGEIVPISFQEKFNIKIDGEGRALETWPSNAASGDYFEVCYEDADDGYCLCWPDSADFENRITNVLDSRLERMAGLSSKDLKKKFSKEEIKLLEKYNLI